MTKHKVSSTILATSLAGCLTLATVGMLLIPTNTSAAYTVDFNDGTFSSWDGSTYTFDWYKNPTNVDGVTTYTISSASDLAGLAIITNDLSDSAFNYITDKLSASDKVYATTVDDFEGKVIKLDTDVDLADYDWLGIGYPWNTPALTASTPITNTEGETVTYNAVDYIPDDTVDPWVGDKNGDPISTRYKEYPEAELRFRDLINPISTDSTHKLVEDTIDSEEYRMCSTKYQLDDSFFRRYPLAYMEHTGSSAGPQGEILPGVGGVSPDYAVPYCIDDISIFSFVKLEPIDYEKDVAIPYTFKDIKGYTTTKGFAGTFDGQDHKVKGLNPDTTWTDDTKERLTTYEPIARGLFSMLDEKGTIKDLAVKGKYDNEICSYSSLLCAYNYGLIDSCYVDGEMSQSLVEQIYPIARDYDPDGSVYKLSSTAGTVMPSGNAGFMTSQNYGTIINSYTVGEVTQAFRQFGFFASTNYGTIKNCENRANLSSSPVTTDFHTDEWSYAGTTVCYPDTVPVLINSAFYDPIKDIQQSQPSSQMPLKYSHVATMDMNRCFGEYYIIKMTTAGFNGLSTNMHDPWYCREELWIPALYKTEVNESIAANHIYGQYEITLAGGIAAVNSGVIELSKNIGTIKNIDNLTVCDGTYSVYTDAYSDLSQADDLYSYIRPSNQYGLFSTAVNGVEYTGGIAAVNLMYLDTCFNTGVIDADYSVLHDRPFLPNKSVRLDMNTPDIGIIAATQNGFYQNDVKFNYNDSVIYTPWGLRWWVTEETRNTNLVENYTEEYFDRNMPYPAFSLSGSDIILAGAGICGGNTGDILNCSSDSQSVYQICYISAKNLYQDKNATIRNCEIASVACRYLYNTDVSDIIAQDTFARGIYQTEDMVSLCNLVLNHGTLVSKEIKGDTKDYLTVRDVVSLGSNYFCKSADTTSFYNIYSQGPLVSNNFPTTFIVGFNDRYYEPSFFTDSLTNTDYMCLDEEIYFGSVNCSYSNILIDKCIDDVSAKINTIFNKYHFDMDSAQARLLNEHKLNSSFITKKVRDAYISQVKMPETSSILCSKSVGDVYSNLAIVNSNFYSLGKFENSSLSNVFIDSLTSNSDNKLGGLGTFNNCTLADITSFSNNAFMYCDSCEVSNVMSYGTVSSEFVEDHKEDYIYSFRNCNCRDMYLESEIDFVYQDPLTTGKIQRIPGVLKAYTDTNEFDHCAIVTPDGAISYASANVLDTSDNSIKTDAKLVYSENAARNGALAYYLDHGYSDERTYDFTVAMTDTVQYDSYLPESVRQYLSEETLASLAEEHTLPAYTRRKLDESEDSYYSIQVPYVSAGAGEIKISVDRDSETWATNAIDNLFPKTELYTIPGETINFAITAEEGFELKGLTWSTKTGSTKLESLSDASKPYTFESAVMPAEDVIIESDWSNVWRIEIDDSLADWLSLTPSAEGAASDRLINLAVDVKDPKLTVGEVYYYPYVKNADNNWMIDTNDKHVVDLAQASFTMPNTHIRLYATALNTEAELRDIVIAGTHGVIDEFNNVTVSFDSSIDITNLVVDAVELSSGATISPAIDESQDFTKPVTYTVTSESGQTTEYIVQIRTTQDGFITQFDLLGRHGVINQDTGVITITLPEGEDVTSTSAYVIWSGTDISPNPESNLDYSNDVVFTVTDSQGATKQYTVTIQRQAFNSSIEDFELISEDMVLEYSINPDTKTILVEYPYGADVSKVTLSRFAYAGVNSNLIPGQTLNLTISHKIVIVDDLGNTEEFTLMANEKPNPVKEITQFVLYGYEGVIDQANNTITLEIPSKYDITDIAPDAVGYIGAAITDTSNKQDFSSPIEYTVTGFDGSSRSYLVTVIQI